VSGRLGAGVASLDITPPVGLHIAGGLSPTTCQGTRDPLLARALVLDDGAARAALVELDIIGIERTEALRAREIVASRTGIPPENVMLACSHTHQGPTTIHYAACEWPTAYMEALPRRIGEVVAAAAAGLEPVEWGLGVGQEATLGHYRRVRLTDGRMRNTWQLPDDAVIDHALGEVDPEVPVLGFQAGGVYRAVVVNYSCHATCRGDGRWSANYPGYLAAALGERLGIDPGRVLYTGGAAANTNPTDEHVDAAIFGPKLAEAALAALESVEWRAAGRLAVRERTLTLPPRHVDRFPYRQVEEIWNNRRSQLGFALALKYYADEYAKLVARGPVPIETAIQALALGDVALVTIPGELFVELGREIERRSPFAHTIVVTLANDWVGYIPHRAAFDEGGYETIFASQSRLAPETGDLVVEACVELLSELASDGGSRRPA
jgi:neutral ceramidase